MRVIRFALGMCLLVVLLQNNSALSRAQSTPALICQPPVNLGKLYAPLVRVNEDGYIFTLEPSPTGPKVQDWAIDIYAPDGTRYAHYTLPASLQKAMETADREADFVPLSLDEVLLATSPRDGLFRYTLKSGISQPLTTPGGNCRDRSIRGQQVAVTRGLMRFAETNKTLYCSFEVPSDGRGYYGLNVFDLESNTSTHIADHFRPQKAALLINPWLDLIAGRDGNVYFTAYSVPLVADSPVVQPFLPQIDVKDPYMVHVFKYDMQSQQWSLLKFSVQSLSGVSDPSTVRDLYSGTVRLLGIDEDHNMYFEPLLPDNLTQVVKVTQSGQILWRLTFPDGDLRTASPDLYRKDQFIVLSGTVANTQTRFCQVKAQ